MAETVRIQYMPLSGLQRWPRNPKKHSLGDLDKSIERFGFVQPITLDENTGRLVAGHGRLDALAAMKEEGKDPPARVKVKGNEWLVPVIRGVSFKDESEAEAYVVADNRLVEIGGWDEEALASILSDLKGIEGGLDGLGWGDGEVERLLADVKQAPTRGTTPDQRLVTFVAGNIKQIVMYLSAEEYALVVPRLTAVAEQLGVESHTAAVIKILEHYETCAGATQ